ncbi:MAG: hypothetical protein KF866_07420 [Phycisphaeraceae bacterium]|nr:hypothetical protein [Phycisphaeraceae bacterium]
MGLDIALTGKFKQSGAANRQVLEDLAARLPDVCDNLSPDFIDLMETDEGDAVFIALHPAADAAVISIPERGRLECVARTNSCGPGYHQFVVELFDRAAELLNVTWDRTDCEDDTEYFFKRDRKALEDSMLNWLSQCSRMLLESVTDESNTLAMCYALSNSIPHLPGKIITPYGPRTFDWLRSVAADPSLGRDFFPWWEPGYNARTMLGIARCLMWDSVRWAVPAQAASYSALVHTHELLAQAYRLDPTLAYPWAEWHEIITLIRACEDNSDYRVDSALAERVAAHAAKAQPPSIGYLRGNVTHRFIPGWTFDTPGAFEPVTMNHDNDEDDDEDSSPGFCLAMSDRVLNFGLYEVEDDHRGDPQASAGRFHQSSARHLGQWQLNGCVVSATGWEAPTDDGDTLMQVDIVAVGPDQILTIHAFMPPDAPVDWTLDIARSISHDPDAASADDDEDASDD